MPLHIKKNIAAIKNVPQNIMLVNVFVEGPNQKKRKIVKRENPQETPRVKITQGCAACKPAVHNSLFCQKQIRADQVPAENKEKCDAEITVRYFIDEQIG